MRLIIEDDVGRKVVVPVEREEITIGRHEGNHIRLSERNVSRRHCRLLRMEGALVLEDLQSSNGLWLNGTPIVGRHPVAPGDRIGIGDYEIEIDGALLSSSDPRSAEASAGAIVEPTLPRASVAAPPQPRAAPPATARPAAARQPIAAPLRKPAPIPSFPKPTPIPKFPQPSAIAQPPTVTPAAAATPAATATPAAAGTQTMAPAVAQAQAPTSATPKEQAGSLFHRVTEAVPLPAPPPNFVPKRELQPPPPPPTVGIPGAKPGAILRLPPLAPAPPKEVARLVVLTTELAGTSVAVSEDGGWIGRGPNAEIVLDHRSLAPRHCRLEPVGGGGFRITPADPSLTLSVNGEPSEDRLLQKGDTVRMGTMLLRLVGGR